MHATVQFQMISDGRQRTRYSINQNEHLLLRYLRAGPPLVVIIILSTYTGTLH